MKYAIVKLENESGYRLVRDEMGNGFFVPYSGIISKYRCVDKKTVKGVQNWFKKHFTNYQEELEIIEL